MARWMDRRLRGLAGWLVGWREGALGSSGWLGFKLGTMGRGQPIMGGRNYCAPIVVPTAPARLAMAFPSSAPSSTTGLS